uniref:Uncharacterized protein n=1 Tax=Timema douglasi TaxID=61478 RepID=A0A7R8VIN8_TIMDO|nr:unnamed protein product [Timema douglasi]
MPEPPVVLPTCRFHTPARTRDKNNSIDEIVLSYVVSILEDLGSESSVEEAFDVEGFCEMMAAYFPEFSTIHHASVCQWMFELEASMSQKKRKDGNGSLIGKDLSQLAMLPLAATTPRSHTNSECSSDGPTKRVHQLSETSDGSSDSSGDYYYSGHEEVDEKKITKTQIARWHSILKSTIFTILKMREEIVNAVQKEGHNVKAKNVKGATHTNMEQAMLEWFRQRKVQNVLINRPMMQMNLP